MAFFPKIQTPCPYKADLAAVMDGDFCRMCKRTVFDLSHMDGDEKRAFLSGCTGEVCISYRFRPAIAAAALAAAAMPTAAAAQELGPAVPDAAAIAASTAEIAALDESFIVVGGIKDPRNVQYVENPTDRDVPPLPIVYEDPPARGDAPAPASRAGKAG